MREIKFRAWLKDCENGNKYALYFDLESISQGSIMARDSEWHYLVNLKNSIEQYTGLKDKNGKEIYEGDIIHNLAYGGVAFITWGNCNKDYAGWCIEWLDHVSKRKGWRDLLYYKNLENCEVIGNIHENPELLEESK